MQWSSTCDYEWPFVWGGLVDLRLDLSQVHFAHRRSDGGGLCSGSRGLPIHASPLLWLG